MTLGAFFKLPSEIRLLIYAEVVGAFEIEYPALRTPERTPALPTPKQTLFSFGQPWSGLLLSNKDVATDFKQFLFARTTFIFPVTRIQLDSFKQWPQFSRQALNKIQKLRFRRDYNREDDDEAWAQSKFIDIGRMVDQCRALRNLSVSVVLTPAMLGYGITEGETNGGVNNGGGINGGGINGGRFNCGMMHNLESHVENVEQLDLMCYGKGTGPQYWEYVL